MSQQKTPIYSPAIKTNVVDTWRRFGWVPPSEQKACQEKWRNYKGLDCRASEGGAK